MKKWEFFLKTFAIQEESGGEINKTLNKSLQTIIKLPSGYQKVGERSRVILMETSFEI